METVRRGDMETSARCDVVTVRDGDTETRIAHLEDQFARLEALIERFRALEANSGYLYHAAEAALPLLSKGPAHYALRAALAGWAGVRSA